MKPVNIGILGLGTVGCGTVSVLKRNAEEITRRAGREIRVTQAAARDLKKKRSCETEGIELTDDANAVVTYADIDVVVELIGGYDIARELVLKAIDNGKHVVTANKALIAAHGNEIFSAAQKKGVTVAFEAAVAGGIPVIICTTKDQETDRAWGMRQGALDYVVKPVQEADLISRLKVYRLEMVPEDETRRI